MTLFPVRYRRSLAVNVPAALAWCSHVVDIRKYITLINRETITCVVTEDGRTYLFTSADDNNVVDDMMMMMMMCPHVSS